MNLLGRSGRSKRGWDISDAEPRVGSTKLTAAIARGALMMTMILALVMMAALPVQGQTLTLLYSFCSQPNCSDGIEPTDALTPDGAGGFYGTAAYGGQGYGVIFNLSPNGDGGWNYTVLYTFTGEGDGAYPIDKALVLDSKGNLYGTTYTGQVFELSPTGTGWTESVLYDVGGQPQGGVIMDQAGNFYGTTSIGGPGGNGGVFELSPSGSGWTEQMIYDFEGSGSSTSLTMNAAGDIFGTTNSTLFELSPNGNGGWTSRVLYTFCVDPTDGCGPSTPVLDGAGNLYVTTGAGLYGSGAVYEVSPGKENWTAKLLHAFEPANGTDGCAPWTGVVLDGAGNIYGTTGGCGKSECGTVWELAVPVSTIGYREKVLWSFNWSDGDQPDSTLILDKAGNLYGTTVRGGANGEGVVFELTP